MVTCTPWRWGVLKPSLPRMRLQWKKCWWRNRLIMLEDPHSIALWCPLLVSTAIPNNMSCQKRGTRENCRASSRPCGGRGGIVTQLKSSTPTPTPLVQDNDRSLKSMWELSLDIRIVFLSYYKCGILTLIGATEIHESYVFSFIEFHGERILHLGIMVLHGNFIANSLWQRCESISQIRSWLKKESLSKQKGYCSTLKIRREKVLILHRFWWKALQTSSVGSRLESSLIHRIQISRNSWI